MLDKIIDSNEEPILYSQIEEKYSDLLEKKRLFYKGITEMNQIIDTMDSEGSKNISLLKTKFNDIENQKNKISEYINNLNNLIPDEDIPMSIKLRNLADIVSNDFRYLNLKFQNIIINTKNKEEQLQSRLNSDISPNDKSTDHNLNDETILNKEKSKTKEKENKQINDVSNSMKQSKEENIKYNESNQNCQTEIIDSNNFIGNEELKEDVEEKYNYNKYIGLIIIFIIIFVFLVYYI